MNRTTIPAPRRLAYRGPAILSDGFRPFFLLGAIFGKLTEACNHCHRSAGVGFVVIRIPTASPFSNQFFPPTQPR